MLPMNLNDLAPSHIQALIDSEVPESLMLEYKQQLPTRQTDETREFVYDIAAMANSAGGHIVYGITDRRGEDSKSTGIADKLFGVRISNPQAEIDRLTNLIRDSIAPRLTGVVMQPVSCDEGDALVIRVPRSWNRPHMVTAGGVNKFFARAATGKYPMSVDEIGRAFSEQSELGERIREWRSHRAELLALGKGPAPLASEVAMLFHVIPADSFSRGLLRGTWRVTEDEKNYMHVPHGPYHPRYNADGFICLAQTGVTQDATYGYTQMFRSGIVEYVDSNCFWPPMGGTGHMLLAQELEKQMVQCYKDAITRYRKQGRNEALYVGFSLIGIEGKQFFFNTMSLAFPQSTVRQNVFTSPEMLVDPNEPEDQPFEKTLLPLVDTMWQVGGYQGTPCKRQGAWTPFFDFR